MACQVIYLCAVSACDPAEVQFKAFKGYFIQKLISPSYT